MSITPGFRAKKKFIMVALRGVGDNVGEDYIDNGGTPKAILTSGLTVDPLQTEQISRDLDDGENGGQPVIQVNEMIKITAPFELAGSGAANTPAAWSVLAQIAGRDEKTDVPTEVSHNRIKVAESEQDGTIYFYWQGMYHIALACKASLSRSGKMSDRFMCTAEITGIYGGTIEGTPPAADFTAFKKPRPFSKANTSFTLDGQALNLYEYELADNAAIEYDEGTEVKRIFIDDWNEEGKFIIEAPALSTFDPFALQLAGTIVPFELVHGTSAGAIVKEASTGIQIMTVKPAEQKGKQCWDLACRVIRGNDSVLTTQ